MCVDVGMYTYLHIHIDIRIYIYTYRYNILILLAYKDKIIHSPLCRRATQCFWGPLKCWYTCGFSSRGLAANSRRLTTASNSQLVGTNKDFDSTVKQQCCPACTYSWFLAGSDFKQKHYRSHRCTLQLL